MKCFFYLFFSFYYDHFYHQNIKKKKITFIFFKSGANVLKKIFFFKCNWNKTH